MELNVVYGVKFKDVNQDGFMLSVTARNLEDTLYQINEICSVRSPCLAMLTAIRKLLIKLIWYYFPAGRCGFLTVPLASI